jgi:serine-type D-Ala-D-Ala carboxypeptidase (penicillin-binding protein 5/6)
MNEHSGPPQVPGERRPPGVERAERSVLEGGSRRRRSVRQRRRGGRGLTWLALVVVVVGVGGGTYLGLERGNESRAGSRVSTVAVSDRGLAGTVDRSTTTGTTRQVPGRDGGSRKVRSQQPLLPAEPTPEVPLAGVDAFQLRLRKPPSAALVFDVDSGEVLWRRRPMKTLPIASLTKIMTALIVTERTHAREPVRITKAALNYSGSGMGVLPRGRRVRLETLLNGLLIVSGNDAAIALAVHVAGTERRFVRLMNEHARAWGLHCTHYSDSHGLGIGDRSCPHDLAVLTRIAMKRHRITRIARRQQVSFHFPIKGHKLYLSGHNPLIRNGYRGAIGLKTGYTDAAGRCYVGVVRRGGRTLAVVLLHSPNPDVQAPKLMDRAFAAVGVR